MYLNEDKIVEIISEYILDKRYKQAILIDGDWGCGKTYFVKEILQDRLATVMNEKADKRKIYYISLYGVATIQQLIDELYFCTLETFVDEKFGKGKGALCGKGLNIISKLATTAGKYFSIDTADFPKVSDLFDFKNSILIFDDLERCDAEINQIFGFLNDLVEHNDLKVILVANQTEIGKTFLTKELAHKYSVVLNENLLLDDKQKCPINFELLKQYTEQLFSHDIVYDKVKEKLIGLTVHYRVDLQVIYTNIIDKNIENSDAKKYLLKNINHVIQLFENNKYYNIRTLIFSLTRFEKIYALLNTIEFEPYEYIDNQLLKILVYCVKESIYIKLGSKQNPLNIDTSGLTSLYSCEAIDNYIQYGFLDETMLKKYVINVASEYKERDDQDYFRSSLYFNKLSAWWELEDEDIRAYLTCMRKELQEKIYTPNYFKEIIVLLMQLKFNGFEEITYEEYISDMAKYLKDMKNINFSTDAFKIYSTENDFLENYKAITKPLFEILIQNSEIQKTEINNCFDKECGWGEIFCDYCEETNFCLSYSFLHDIDIVLLLERLRKSKLVDLYDFLKGIKKVYNFGNLYDFFKSDIPNITELLNFTEDILRSDGSITRSYYFKSLQRTLTDSLENIENK